MINMKLLLENTDVIKVNTGNLGNSCTLTCPQYEQTVVTDGLRMRFGQNLGENVLDAFHHLDR